MSTSQNGWPASRALRTRPLTVDGVTFFIADNDDVATVFGYILTEYVAHVEPLRQSSCFGYNYRPNVNDPTELSNHSSGTAVDVDAEIHPNAKPTLSTMTRAQVDACHAILASVPELGDLVHWGGDWSSPLTTDAMHWELHSHDLALLARVAERIREETMPLSDADIAKIAVAVAALLDSEKVDKAETVSVRQALNQARNAAKAAAAK